MRKIKFRVWDKYSEKMYYPNNNTMVLEWGEDGKLNFFAFGKADYDWEINGPGGHNKDFEYIMQSTGLIDVNGKEIYENDIVRALGSLIVTSYIVKLGFYENKICACHRKYNSYGWYIESTFANNCYELGDYTHIPEMGLQILGNIYEHKELLNGTSES